ncbi:hypothetical protein [Flavobacterium luteum]|uniref:Uncharacterized protein n=1 Tax=Flavobacterium luteum TaxID=2026654 RepID=A0A7J5AJG3_9FLAO|nr:hypothetical protein [Flavobacterium luteum]KAB1157747.1 hypothetical protein F6464_01290 [Flavobacterium luteum]
MKTAFLVILLFLGITMATAQVEKLDDHQEIILDKIDQEPQQPSQISVERASRIEAKRTQDEKKAEKRAKKIARKQARDKAKQPPVQ